MTGGLSVDFCFLPDGPVSESVALAALGEELGYRGMWIPDQGFYRDAFIIAACAAAATRRLQIGIGITSPLLRHPAHLARVAASLDEISGYRLRLGLGVGNVAHVLRPMGISSKDTVERMNRGILSIDKLLRGGSVKFAEETAGEVKLDFTPSRVMPLYVGARGPKMLEMAGSVADGVLIESLFNASGMPDAVSRIARGVRQGSRSIASVDVLSWQLVVVTDDPAAEIERYRGWIARTIQAGPREAILRTGVEEHTYDRVTAAMKAGDVHAATKAVTDDAVHCLMLIGSGDYLAERIATLEDHGCTSISVLSTGSLTQTAANLINFARTVMPAISSTAASSVGLSSAARS